MMRNLALSTIIVAAAIAFELHAQSSVEPADAPTTAVADTQDVTIAFDAAILSETERRHPSGRADVQWRFSGAT